jgi:quinol monooxygenase YgiN
VQSCRFAARGPQKARRWAVVAPERAFRYLRPVWLLLEREERLMVSVLIHHRVADYDSWKRGYDAIMEGPLASNVRAYRIWRGCDDPNLVILCETYESREAVNATFANPVLLEAIAATGVEMPSLRVDIADEVASGKH